MWRTNDWKTKAGDPIKNLELWQNIYQFNKEMNITYVKVKGHNGVQYNEEVDKIARANSKLAKEKRDAECLSVGS
jgi:ribonuclease HI